MARDQVDRTPIESRDELIAWIAAGAKSPAEFRIGTEHEKLPFTLAGRAPVPYEGARGIRALLAGMRHLLGWEPIMEGEHIIGLADVTGGGAITLEPGGQFELSGAPLETVHQTCSEVHAHLAQLRQVAAPLGVGFLGIGMSPKWTRAETPVMPKGRYKIMAAYMPNVGKLGVDMMFRTCTVQVNLDFSSEADMVKKLRVGLALCMPTRRSPKAGQTIFFLIVPKSGAIPTLIAPACCLGCSRAAWASSGGSTTRSTCRCISSSAATAMSTSPANPSAT
jgi:glutamate--cysteine ligase